MKRLIINGDIVYVLKEIEAPRNVNPNASRKANELIIFGFILVTFAKVKRPIFRSPLSR